MIDWSVAIESYLEPRRVDWNVAIVSHASHAPGAGAKCSYGRHRVRLEGILIEFEAEPSLQNRTLAGSCTHWRGGGSSTTSTATAAAGGGIAPSSPAVRRVLHGQHFLAP